MKQMKSILNALALVIPTFQYASTYATVVIDMAGGTT